MTVREITDMIRLGGSGGGGGGSSSDVKRTVISGSGSTPVPEPSGMEYGNEPTSAGLLYNYVELNLNGTILSLPFLEIYEGDFFDQDDEPIGDHIRFAKTQATSATTVAIFSRYWADNTLVLSGGKYSGQNITPMIPQIEWEIVTVDDRGEGSD